ncbi:MAG: chloride channel protein [Cytophagales bacterium]|nr:chloride channel protein [Cytophagales bacterium]
MKFLVWRLKHISDNNFILIVAGIIGLVAGIAAVTLKTSVHFIQEVLRNNIHFPGGSFIYIAYPIIGIFLTVAISKFLFKESLGHGITQILYAISKNSSIIRRTRMYSRMITSALTVGFGGSVGLEAPIVVTGSAIGSNLARLVHLNYKRRTLLIGCGSAGAVSAIFNSPIAGVIFAVEVILTEVTISKFIPILIASVAGQLVTIILLGEDILFSFRIVDGFSAKDTPYYFGLGMVCGLASLYFTRVMFRVEDAIQNIRNSFRRVLVGGLALALILLIFPPIYGEGYDTIKQLLSHDEIMLFEGGFLDPIDDNQYFLIAFLLLVVLIKPVASALTIGAGGSGGIFAPSLFMGGVTGFLIASVYNILIPGANVSLSNFTLVGMCGVMSGVLHAPLTAIFLIAEITGGYMLFVPLMLVSALAFTTISYFEEHSFYTKHLIEKGDLIPYDKDQIVLSLIDMKKIIETDLLAIHPEKKLGDLVALVRKSKRNIFPVLDEENVLHGIVTLDDIRDIMFDPEKRDSISVQAIMQKPPGSVSSREKMQSVMNKFQLTQAWNLPVIDDGKYVGFVSKSRIFNAYRNKLRRQNQE